MCVDEVPPHGWWLLSSINEIAFIVPTTSVSLILSMNIVLSMRGAIHQTDSTMYILFSIWGPLMWSHFIHMHAWCTFVVNFIMNRFSSIWYMSILRLSFCSHLFFNQICSVIFFSHLALSFLLFSLCSMHQSALL